MRNFKKIVLAAVAAAAVAGLAACNTVEGFGEDLEKGGEKLQEKADR